jgi:hypothetical protein
MLIADAVAGRPGGAGRRARAPVHSGSGALQWVDSLQGVAEVVFFDL